MSQDWTVALIPLLIGAIFAVIGVAMVIFGQVQRNKARATEKWPTANGVIVSSRVETRTTREYDEGRSYNRTTHAPMIEYTYDVGGRTYQGSKVFPGANMTYDLGTTQGIVNRYQPGQPAAVHYDPADPAQAVLETKSGGGRLFFILGIVFAGIGLLACCAGGALVLLA